MSYRLRTVALLAGSLVAACGVEYELRSEPPVHVVPLVEGRTVPEIPVAAWLDDRAPTEEELSGRPAVIEFWATWCPPCVRSTPHLVELAERHRDAGLVVFGIHVAKRLDRDEVAAFRDRHRIPYKIGLDETGAAAKRFRVSPIPRAFVYDRAGQLVHEGNPLMPAFDEAVARVVAR